MNVFSIITIFTATVFFENYPVIQACVFGISHIFRLCAFIESFQLPFLEDSIEIIIADFWPIILKR